MKLLWSALSQTIRQRCLFFWCSTDTSTGYQADATGYLIGFKPSLPVQYNVDTRILHFAERKALSDISDWPAGNQGLLSISGVHKCRQICTIFTHKINSNFDSVRAIRYNTRRCMISNASRHHWYYICQHSALYFIHASIASVCQNFGKVFLCKPWRKFRIQTTIRLRLMEAARSQRKLSARFRS